MNYLLELTETMRILNAKIKNIELNTNIPIEEIRKDIIIILNGYGE